MSVTAIEDERAKLVCLMVVLLKVVTVQLYHLIIKIHLVKQVFLISLIGIKRFTQILQCVHIQEK